MNPRFRLDVFEGPLDLLLHLIKKDEVDVANIEIARITEQYLAYLEFLDQLNLDLAGEYLVMAATLIHLKSRALLPADAIPPDEGANEPDLEELKRQLEEYARYKQAAIRLDNRSLLGRDVFRRGAAAHEAGEQAPLPLRKLGLGDLVEALRAVLARLPEDRAHEIAADTVSVADRIPVVLARLELGKTEFARLFEGSASRREVVVTFLALLELVRTRVVRAAQSESFGAIELELAISAEEAAAMEFRNEYED